ncbi:PorV/PorQ family protein [Saccharicrinis aurantiacus]|uniref:hypothetical protein n=1 Tax=Saccharicrinis aurantiacus TaxID=1849719 RepID=UPI00094FEC8D|nr:hypothetical protein [Saccharicrinis aurantiacus]
MSQNLAAIIIVLLYSCNTFCQNSLHNSPVSNALAGIYSTRSDVWSAFQNPAGNANFNKVSSGISYSMPYGIKELSSQKIASTLPTKIGNIGASYQSFGFSLYKEQNISLSYSKSITEKVAAGFQLNYANYFSSQSGNGGQLYSSIGLQFQPIKHLKIGASITNPEQASLTINTEEVHIPSYYALGISWLASDQFSLSYEFEKQSDYGVISKFGLEYNYQNFLWFKGGISGKPILYSFGLGLKLKQFIVDYAASFHEALGMTSSIGLTFNWHKDE